MAMDVQSVRTRQQVASVTMDGDFAHFQMGCGHVTCRREGNLIVLIAGPDCQLAASGGPDIVTVAVNSKKDEKH
jgi:hypothetical protein